MEKRDAPTSEDSPKKRIKKLGDEDASKIIATSAIPSLHNVVEELILNSIDARATEIQVIVTISAASLEIEVRDNGQGIQFVDMQLSVGEPNCSSKTLHQQYGMKGQALASIRQLANSVDIYSKSSTRSEIIFKHMTPRNAQLTSLPSSEMVSLIQGTVVCVKGLFDLFPVRKHSVRSNVEIMLIQDFINNMSVLHHRIAWRLFDECNGRTVLSLHGVPSVAKRLMVLHSEIVATKVHPFAYTDGTYSIEGLISFPRREDCSITKDCQYMFINDRWMRNRDPLTKLLNDVFGKALNENLNCGPSAKHVKTNYARYPKYVVKFMCPQNEIDLLVEPDKTVPIFAHIHAVLKFVRKALLTFSSGRYPIFDAILQQFEGMVTHEVPVNSQAVDIYEMPLSMMVESYRSNQTPHSMESDHSSRSQQLRAVDTSSASAVNNLFTQAFLFADDDTAISTSSCAESEPSANVVPARSVAAERHRPSRVSHKNENLVVKESITSENHELGLTDSEVVNPNVDPSSRDIVYSPPLEKDAAEIDIWGVQPSVTQNAFARTVEESPEENLDIGINSSIQYHTLHASIVDSFSKEHVSNEGSFSLSVDYLDRLQQAKSTNTKPSSLLASCATTMSSMVPTMLSNHSNLIPEEITLSKESLRDLKIIAQWDNKFILCSGTVINPKNNNLKVVLFALDQHAVDERINYEKMMTGIKHSMQQVDLSTVNEQSRYSFGITANEREIFLHHIAIFQSWYFDYSLVPDSNEILVKAVPQVLGERLSVEDLQEFNHFIFNNLELPSSRMMPPAVMRIVASKACRSSIKFGTPLSENRIKGMLDDLSSTSQPFQCAHGRPSLVPLIQFPHDQSNTLRSIF